jgi:sodium transport system permease protein
MRETLRKIGIVFAKESLDNLRDRRSLLLALVYPLMGPLLLGVLMSLVTGVVRPETDAKAAFRLPVAGTEHAPDLIAFLAGRDVTVVPAPDEPEQAVQVGTAEVVLVIEAGFAERLAAGRRPTLFLVTNSSRITGVIAANRAVEALNAFNQELAGRRLRARGVDPAEVFEPVQVDSVNVASRYNLVDMFLFMVPPFIIFTVFMGGVYLAIDTTSGERERGSLEPLLVNPVPRWALMLGKFLAALLFTAAAVAVQLAAFKAMFAMLGDRGPGFGHILGLADSLAVGLVALPLMMLAVGVQVIIATVTRSFKEAQTYLGLLPLIPAMPGLALVFVPLQPKTWMMAVPGFSQTLLFGQYVRGEAVSALHIGVSAAVTAAVALLLVYGCARLYEREELIFGG